VMGGFATLQRRVMRLESGGSSGAGSDRCPECGHEPHSRPKFEIRTQRAEPGDPPLPPNRHCSTCGRVLEINVGGRRPPRS
jgi:hypothetical protein